jgi:hypothetical protein
MTNERTETHACDCVNRQAAIEALDALCDRECEYSKKQRSVMCGACHLGSAFDVVEQLPSAQPERLTDDDFETIRIHLNAYKEKLCNQQRWEEADEYQRIIDRFMAFASAQPERKTGEWTEDNSCSICGFQPWYEGNIHTLSFCPNCGADMRGENDG